MLIFALRRQLTMCLHLIEQLPLFVYETEQKKKYYNTIMKVRNTAKVQKANKQKPITLLFTKNYSVFSGFKKTNI